MNKQNFPERKYTSGSDFAASYQRRFNEIASGTNSSMVDVVADLILKTIKAGGTIYVCGNGGSAAIANHITCDYAKSLSLSLDCPVKVISLCTFTELNLAIANDISFDEVFAFQVRQNATAKDILWAISSSGKSLNIVKALNTAREKGMQTIAFTAFDGGLSRKIASYCLHAPVNNYGIAEDIHHMYAHIIYQYIRQQHMIEEDIASVIF